MSGLDCQSRLYLIPRHVSETSDTKTTPRSQSIVKIKQTQGETVLLRSLLTHRKFNQRVEAHKLTKNLSKSGGQNTSPAAPCGI